MWHCKSIVGEFRKVAPALSEFANDLLEVSYKYMLMASQFDSAQKERPGFSAHFDALSHRSWAAGMNLVKYITSRGGHVKFNRPPTPAVVKMSDQNELQAMATVLDTEKGLFQKAAQIYKQSEDPTVAEYMNEQFMKNMAKSIRKYSGIVNDLKSLYASSHDISMDNHLFDQYLMSG